MSQIVPVKADYINSMMYVIYMYLKTIEYHFQSLIYICNNSTYRWAQLKDALIDNRSKLGEAQTLQQFSRDADEMENWLQEKLQIASDESYKDPSNIQVLKQVIMLLSVTSPKIKLK